jgi:hypothetical protein
VLRTVSTSRSRNLELENNTRLETWTRTTASRGLADRSMIFTPTNLLFQDTSATPHRSLRKRQAARHKVLTLKDRFLISAFVGPSVSIVDDSPRTRLPQTITASTEPHGACHALGVLKIQLTSSSTWISPITRIPAHCSFRVLRTVLSTCTNLLLFYLQRRILYPTRLVYIHCSPCGLPARSSTQLMSAYPWRACTCPEEISCQVSEQSRCLFLAPDSRFGKLGEARAICLALPLWAGIA